MKIAYYLSGHGMGHATRSMAVMEALRSRIPEHELYIRTKVPRRLFDLYLGGRFHYEEVATDVGVVEKDILNIDIDASEKAWREFLPKATDILESEAAFLRRQNIDRVLFDLPPLAPAIAARAGVPSFGVSNFSWDYIYAPYVATHPFFGEVLSHVKEWYAQTTLLCRLPFHHPMEVFPNRRDVPLLCRHYSGDRAAIREEIDILPHQTAVLVALRGEALNITMNDCIDDIVLLGYGELHGRNVRLLDHGWVERYGDVLLASDMVLSKPGYGIVGECIAHNKPLIHLPRHGFAEARDLVGGMDPYLKNAQVTLDDLRGGALPDVIESLRAAPAPRPIATNGAEVIADLVALPLTP